LKKRICFVATIPDSIKVFLTNHIKAMIKTYDVTVVTNTQDLDVFKDAGLPVNVFAVAIERRISPLRDLAAVLKLYRLFRKQRFDAVHSIMPKSGLLSMVAARCAGVPMRMHTFTGQVWATRRGLGRWFLKQLDRLLAGSATHILVDSHSQRDFIVQQGIVSRSKSSVIANGSICGVDTERFSPDPRARASIREHIAVSENETLFLFLGRLTLDKGLLNLANAFSGLCKIRQGVHLMVAGPDEEGVKSRMLEACKGYGDRIHFEGFTNVPEHYMAAADVFCLPSYREGFGQVVVEAASCGIPSIGTRIYGIVDAIEDGVTGFLYPPGNADALMSLMLQMCEDARLRETMGERARARAINLFARKVVTSAFVEYYDSVLN